MQLHVPVSVGEVLDKITILQIKLVHIFDAEKRENVQNELVAAYNELRDREFRILNPNLGLSFVEANKRYSDPRTSPSEKENLKPKLSVLKLMYPQKLSEAEPSKTN